MNTKTKCLFCGNYGGVEARRRLTAYEDDLKNYMMSCYRCFKADCELLEDMWSEYRASVGFADYNDDY